MRALVAGVLLGLLGLIPGRAETSPAMIGRLAVNQTHIVFSYAGDLWSVERGGGEARRLTTHPAEESYPAFSPDGSQLAFSRQVGGSWDVWVMPAGGGEARRLTYRPRNEYALCWSPDGKSLLYRGTETGAPRLYTIRLEGVTPTELPFAEAVDGWFSPDAKRLAVTPNSSIGDWRFYRGGNNGRIWISNTSDWSVEAIAQGTHNDEFPMWIADRVYFVSDRSGIFNLYVYDVRSKQTKQLTSFEKYGIRWASAGAGAVVFVRDGRIHLHDIAAAQTRVVDARLKADAPELMPRKASVARTIESVSLSNSGDRVIIGSRGEVVLFDPSTSLARNLSETTAVAERYPVLSPDGNSVAYLSDESGEYQLHIKPLGGDSPVKKITIEAKPSFYRELFWSPDSKRLVFSDHRLGLWIADAESRTATRIDASSYSFQEEWRPGWSPDGRWLTYSKHLRNRVRTVFIYDVENKQSHQTTDGRTHSELPVFDANGKYLYFASSANAGTSEFGWGVLNGVLARPLVTRRLHAIVLQKNEQAPVLPNGSVNADAKIGEVVSRVQIDFDGIDRRVVDLPPPPRDYSQLASGRPGVLYALITEWPSPPVTGNPSRTLYVIDLNKSNRLEKLIENVEALELSVDGRRLLFSKARTWFLVSTDAPPKPDEGRLELGKLEVNIDPRAEWKQMYHEAWRIMRDWFYDPNHHGLDIGELERHYDDYLPSITRRVDLNALMNRMLGHVSVSHLGVGGGDVPLPGASGPSIALLGADYEIADNRYRFKRIYRASTFNGPVGSVGAPLDRPGIEVREGEYLLAVDGQNIDTTRDVYASFEGKGPGAVKITVGPNANGDGSRTISVFTIPNEANLRLANEVEAKRRRVEQASGGKLGYIYVSNYGIPGIQDFIRGLTGYSDRAGVIIDQRYNGGGITPDYLIEWLRRQAIYYYAFREGDDIATPVNPGPATRVLIVNEQNYSAAETFAFLYKLAKVGPIVGRRTGGGGIGPYVFTPRLIDGGLVQLPNRAAYNPDGTSWGVENVGVVPDYEVDILPTDVLAGRDPQLERAIQVAMIEMKKKFPWRPLKPKYPVHR